MQETFIITITFKDGEIQTRKYHDYMQARRACAIYDELAMKENSNIKSVHIREV